MEGSCILFHECLFRIKYSSPLHVGRPKKTITRWLIFVYWWVQLHLEISEPWLVLFVLDIFFKTHKREKRLVQAQRMARPLVKECIGYTFSVILLFEFFSQFKWDDKWQCPCDFQILLKSNQNVFSLCLMFTQGIWSNSFYLFTILTLVIFSLSG